MQTQNVHWYTPLRKLASLGSRKSKLRNMGDLAAARRVHLSQFFTPDDAAAWMWQFVARLPVVSLLDNSIGSARLLQFAEPGKHTLYGVDVHSDTVDEVKRVVSEAGFECEILCAGMENIRPIGFDCSLVNPPFSITLESTGLKAEPGFTRMGRLGPDTSATSDEYAVIQALNAARIVVALLPRSSADAIRTGAGCWRAKKVQDRLRGIFDLPASTFKDENATVLTSVVVFGEQLKRRPVVHYAVENFSEPVPILDLLETTPSSARPPDLRYQMLDASEPTITLPVTGNRTVAIALDGRKISLRYFCGLTQAMVANEILDKRVYSTKEHRLPKGVLFNGQGKLDVETYLAQDTPLAAFNAFVESIHSAGGDPIVRPGVYEAITKKVRRHLRAAMPLKHTVWCRGIAGASNITGHAKKTHNVDPAKWISPVISKGEQVSFTLQSDRTYRYEKNGKKFHIGLDDLEANYVFEDASEGWKIVHHGLLQAYPQEAARLKNRAIDLGISSWLNWDYQIDDLIEATMKPSGCILGWQQALGKSRLNTALILLSGVKHGLIVVESRLIDEMLVQLQRIEIAQEQVCVIDCPEKLNQLSQINLISYERLRMLVDAESSSRITYAHKLRRRIGLVCADEGERLANFDSDQSRALFQLAARKRYISTGTPLANYPRDIHGLLLFTAGDGTAAQPFGHRRGYLEKWWITSMKYASRGVDRIREQFVVIDWCTHTFSESLREGAKREIPKIANVEGFRAWLAPHMKRRLAEEPEVAKYIQLPPTQFETIVVPWDSKHLAYYLTAADEFAQWYRERNSTENGNNLAVILARLQAVHTALNIPQNGIDGLGAYAPLTSKQRAVRDFMIELSAQQQKCLLFCENPGTVTLLHRELAAAGIKSVQFHGGISISRRVKAKDEEFVAGKADHLLATKMSAKAGYNIPGADIVAFYDRSWSAKTEAQAMARPRRVERKKPVKVVYFHLPGSLDIYQDQMVAFKADSARAGLDWATPEKDGEEFLHLSTVLSNFVDDLANFNNLSAHEMRKLLKAA